MTKIIERTCGDLMYGIGELVLLQDASNRSTVCASIVRRVDYKIKTEILRTSPTALVVNHPSEFLAASAADDQEGGTEQLPTIADKLRTDNYNDSSVRPYPDYDYYRTNEDAWPMQDNSFIENKICFLVPYLEGAANLERGGLDFSVSLATTDGLSLHYAVVYLPAWNEIFWSTRDRPAFLQHRRIWPTKNSKLSDGIVVHEFCAGALTKSLATKIFKLRCLKNCTVISHRHLSGSLLRLSMGCIDALITDTLPQWLPAYFIAQRAGIMTHSLDDGNYLVASMNNIKLLQGLLLD